HRLENGLQALIGPPAGRLFHQEKLVVGCLLNLDEVRHLCDFLDLPEKLTNALATCECLRCHFASLCLTVGTGTTLRKAAIHADHPDRRRSPFSLPTRFGHPPDRAL